MTGTHKATFGVLPPLYKFMLNPYPDERLWRCPVCDAKTGQRTLPLLIHIQPGHFMILKVTCRYCSACELLIAPKHDMEHELTEFYKELDPTVVGNEYFVMGTLEKQILRQDSQVPQTLQELRQNAHDFKMAFLELRKRQTGWFRDGEEPPIAEPPPSQEWVKIIPGVFTWHP